MSEQESIDRLAFDNAFRPSSILWIPAGLVETLYGMPVGRWHHATHPNWLVIAGVERRDDGRLWMHVSTSMRHRLPSWEEVVAVKEQFIGEDRHALQLLPKRSEWLNLHPYCLHLWAVLEGEDPLVPLIDPSREES